MIAARSLPATETTCVSRIARLHQIAQRRHEQMVHRRRIFAAARRGAGDAFVFSAIDALVVARDRQVEIIIGDDPRARPDGCRSGSSNGRGRFRSRHAPDSPTETRRPDASRARPPVNLPRYSANRSAESWSTATITISFGGGVAAVTLATGDAEFCARTVLPLPIQRVAARAILRGFSVTSGVSVVQGVSAGCPLGESRLYGKPRETGDSGTGMDRSKDVFVTSLWRAALALVTFALLALSPASAQSTHIQPKLVAESAAPAPGGATTLALTMTPDKGWHGYWINGGDAGFGLSVEWNLPEGVTVAPLRYPVPEPLILFGMMNHVYEHPYALLADVDCRPKCHAGKRFDAVGGRQLARLYRQDMRARKGGDFGRAESRRRRRSCRVARALRRMARAAAAAARSQRDVGAARRHGALCHPPARRVGARRTHLFRRRRKIWSIMPRRRHSAAMATASSSRRAPRARPPGRSPRCSSSATGAGFRCSSSPARCLPRVRRSPGPTGRHRFRPVLDRARRRDPRRADPQHHAVRLPDPQPEGAEPRALGRRCAIGAGRGAGLYRGRDRHRVGLGAALLALRAGGCAVGWAFQLQIPSSFWRC